MKNNIVQEIVKLVYDINDQIIKNAIYEDNTITLFLDSQSKIGNDYEVKLQFKGVESILSKDSYATDDDYFILNLNLGVHSTSRCATNNIRKQQAVCKRDFCTLFNFKKD